MKALSKTELRAARVERRPEDHKGTFGHVLIVAGSAGMVGAAILSTRSALRSGAGLVTLALPAGLQPEVAAQVPEALTLALPEASGGCLRSEAVGRIGASMRERNYTVMAIGPGLSTNPETARAVVHALGSLPLPAVVDADALNILAAQDRADVDELLSKRVHPCVFTPHPGEMARCLRVSREEVLADRRGAVEKLAKEWNGIALLKGHRTLISDGRRTVANFTGGPGLAIGGTGDVLTGLIAGLWAQLEAAGRGGRESAFLAAALGAHLHGLAGDLAEDELTPWAMTPQDVIARLGRAFHRL